MENKKIYVIIGGLWFDSVNGNTYHATKIIDTTTGGIYYTRFQYGYGSQYKTSAAEYIREELHQENPIIIDGGSFKVKKAEAKNGTF
jgi:hypothetical protein